MNFLLRRRKLGSTSCRAISRMSKTGISVVRNDDYPTQGDIVFRWGCTSEVMAKMIVNAAEAIHLVSDKTRFRLILDKYGLSPLTFVTIGQITTYLGEHAAHGAWNLVVRPRVHHQGRKLFVCRNANELVVTTARCGHGWYASPLINKVSEYRVFCVSGRVVCVARKFPADANTVAWNVAQGGRFENVNWNDWPLKAVKTSLEAFALSGLDFGGVDVMVDNEGRCFVLEINAAPSLTSPYRQECFAKAFDYIVEHGKKVIPLIEQRGGYKKFIHPAITNNAQQ